MTRRTAISALGATAWLARPAVPQTIGGGPPPKAPVAGPVICAYSQNLAKVEYPELGAIAEQMGYDGVDLTVREGGHVSPRVLNVDLVRAIESVRGTGLELPMITTSITSATDPAAYPILAITGRTSVHLYRTGQWAYGAGDPARRIGQIRNDLLNLVFLSQRSEMTAMISNRAGGNFGESIWDTHSVIGDMDPRWIGYCYDPSQAVTAGNAAGNAAGNPPGNTAGWEVGLRLALPRLKAVALQDCVWTKSGAAWRMEMCPLGEGMVDWARFFRILADAKFNGPMTVHYEYRAQDELSAMKKDLDFVRKQVAQAWPANPSRT